MSEKPKPKKNPQDKQKGATDERIIRLIYKYSGRITDVAAALTMSVPWIYERIGKTPALKQAVQHARDIRLDKCERALDACVLDNNITAIIFTLKTLGKNRGYIESNNDVKIDLAKIKELKELFDKM